MSNALKGIRVLEFAGLAPVPHCGQILSDFGARVIRIDKTIPSSLDRLCRGKKSLSVDLKKSAGVKIIHRISQKCDVLIEPFRPGVMERLGLGPKTLLSSNPTLIYARLTGYGQHGHMKNRSGHDINYLSISGVLSTLGKPTEPPNPPINLAADFAGGGLTCAMGILLALLDRQHTGKGCVIDNSMVEGAAYVGSFLWQSRPLPWWGNSRGKNFLDGGAPHYNTYKTKDNKFMAVGCLEPQFYSEFLAKLNLDPNEFPLVAGCEDAEKFKKVFADIFSSKSQEEWCEIFDNSDACVTPIVDFDNAANHKHNSDRNSFAKDSYGNIFPRQAPRFSAIDDIDKCLTPFTPTKSPEIGEHTQEILQEFGFSDLEIQEFKNKDIIFCQEVSSKL